MMDLNFRTLLTSFNESFTLFVVFPFIVLLGAYLTIRLKGVQVTKLKMSFSYLLKKEDNMQGNISHFEALSAVLAGNFGTGNVSGMAIALTTGGPGALVWMWMMAFLGAAIQYSSCLLAVKYRKKDPSGEYMGGPMYYLANGLKYKKLAALFSIFAIFGALTVGNFAQINSVILPLEMKLGLNPLLCGFGFAVFVAIVILGGLNRVAKFASYIIPFKAFLYLGAAFIILLFHLDQIPGAFKLMLDAALNGHAVAGGVMGYGITKAIIAGFDRGLFATDAGTGIVPILQSSAKTNNPVIDGVVTLVAPFLVMIVCTTTALVLIVTGAWQQPELRSTNMVTYAFEQGLGNQVGSYIVIVSLILFSYTTILAWACCAERAIGFLTNSQYAKWFNYFYIALIPVGAMIHVDTIWLLADIAISCMLVINLIGVAGLSKEVIDESTEYFSNQEIGLETA